jgi:hypothetical protein
MLHERGKSDSTLYVQYDNSSTAQRVERRRISENLGNRCRTGKMIEPNPIP